MAGVKRKDGPAKPIKEAKKQKTNVKPPKKRSTLEEAADEEDFGGFSDNEEAEEQETNGAISHLKKPVRQQVSEKDGDKKFKLETSSAEAHAKQRALAKERKLSKPNADAIQRSKKLWERLRRKSHVPPEERKTLVAELFELIDGRVRDFVFKHDSVRVIQCALKYANREQRKIIVQELKNDVRTLMESRYGKFLVAKMVVEGDQEVRDAIVPEFYGHVKRLINHPEASWIMDDIYRQIASKQQKATMLREWYGVEFALSNRKSSAPAVAAPGAQETADLKEILERNPEKRGPILEHLLQMINSLVQKKMTGFTMLHDAMLQYFLVLSPDSSEQKEFLEILKGDIDAESGEGSGDLFRNLAFTKNGSRLLCLALAYGSAKDRKMIIRVFKDNIEMMAFDAFAKVVLVTALEVPDDTKMTSKAILHDYIGQHLQDKDERLNHLENIVTNVDARLPILLPVAGAAKWLVKEQDKDILDEVFAIRNTTSKKDPEQRRKEIVEQMSDTLLGLVIDRSESLMQSSFGCVFIGETMLATTGANKSQAIKTITQSAAGNPHDDGHIAKNPFASRMLKALVTGGSFDPQTKRVRLAEPRLGFGTELYPVIKDHLVDWACSDSSFVVVALLESEDTPSSIKSEAKKILLKGKKKIDAAAKGDRRVSQEKAGKMSEHKGNAGSKIVLVRISED